jgi:hypothetical protein
MLNRTLSAIVLVLCVGTLRSLPALAAPEEIVIAVTGASIGIDARGISSYPVAIDAIARVFVDDLKLPLPKVTLEVHDNREEFEAALIKELGLDAKLAKQTAAFAKAAVGTRVVLLSSPAVGDMPWPDRIELLAHELAHTVQVELAGRPLNRQQWLTEGFAEWAAYSVTDRLGLEPLSAARTRIYAKLRSAGAASPLPTLAEMNTFPQWIAARTQHGFDATFTQSFIAVELLMQRHSYDAVIDYFRRFRSSTNYAANFRGAFGETVTAFQPLLDEHLKRLLSPGSS